MLQVDECQIALINTTVNESHSHALSIVLNVLTHLP